MARLPVTTPTLNNDEINQVIGAYLQHQISPTALQLYFDGLSLSDASTIIGLINDIEDANGALVSYLQTHYPPG
jgi:hypothetical protein